MGKIFVGIYIPIYTKDFEKQSSEKFLENVYIKNVAIIYQIILHIEKKIILLNIINFSYIIILI